MLCDMHKALVRQNAHRAMKILCRLLGTIVGVHEYLGLSVLAHLLPTEISDLWFWRHGKGLARDLI